MKPLANLMLWGVLAAICGWAWLAMLRPEQVLGLAGLLALC